MEHPHSDYPYVMPKEERIERVTFRKFFREMLDAFDIERGLLFTIYQLFRRGGGAVIDYLGPRRRSYTPPLRMLVITTAIAVFILIRSSWMTDFFFGFAEGMSGTTADTPSEEVQQIKNVIFDWFNFLMWLSIPAFSLFTILVFRHPYNLAEHMVLFTYFLSIWNVVVIFFTPLEYFFNSDAYGLILIVLYFIGLVYFCATFFLQRGWRLVLGMFVILILGGFFYLAFIAALLGFAVGLQH